MKNTLLEKCNADVFQEIIDIREEHPAIGINLITILQQYEFWWQMTGYDMSWFSAHLSHTVWNGKIYTFHLLFETKETTVMP
jgi:hypothetical protein